MKPTNSARIIPKLPFLIAAWSLSATAYGQQAPTPESATDPRASTAPVEAAPVAPSAATSGVAPAVPVTTGSGTAPALSPQADLGATTAVPSAPGATAYADLPPLPPITNSETKKEKKGKKGKKGRKAPEFGKNEGGDVEWGDPWGDSQDELRAAGLSFRFLLQAHYRQSFGDSPNPEPNYKLGEENLMRHNDGWYVNRLFWRIGAEPSKYVGYKLLLDIAEFQHANGKQSIKQAYVALRPIPKHLHFLVGVLKLPYSILELDPVAKFEFTQMGDADNLTKGMGFAGRDIGAEVVVSPLSKPKYLTLAVGLFRGHAHDENASLIGAVGARAETYPIKGLRLGADWVDFPKTETYLNPFLTGSKYLLPNPENPNFPRSATWLSGDAFSADVTFSRWNLMLRTEGMLGTRVDHDTLYGAKKFGAYWAVASYRFPAGPVDLQPSLRAEWLDTDLEHSVGMRRTLTAAFAAWATKNVRLTLDVARTDVQANSPFIDQPLPLQQAPYNAISNTCVTGQLQATL